MNYHEEGAFENAIKLYPTNQEVKEENKNSLIRSGQPVVIINADHPNTMSELARDDVALGLSTVLYLAIGCRVMLLKNLFVEAGLVNGALGFVTDIIYDEGRRPPGATPRVVFVKFDNYNSHTINGSVPITQITNYWKKGGCECYRRQFPLSLAHAITIHKSQGLTLDRAVVQLGASETSPGLTYVALSRVRKIENLLLVTGYHYNRYLKIGSMKQVKERKSFLRAISSRRG